MTINTFSFKMCIVGILFITYFPVLIYPKPFLIKFFSYIKSRFSLTLKFIIIWIPPLINNKMFKIQSMRLQLSQMPDALSVWSLYICIDISVSVYFVAGIHCLLLWTIWVQLNAVTTPASFASTRISGSNVMTTWSPKPRSMKFWKAKGKSWRILWNH